MSVEMREVVGRRGYWCRGFVDAKHGQMCTRLGWISAMPGNECPTRIWHIPYSSQGDEAADAIFYCCHFVLCRT